MGVFIKRGNLVMSKDKAILIADELVSELKTKLQTKKNANQIEVIKKKIVRRKKIIKKLNNLNDSDEVKKYIKIIFDYFDSYYSVGSKERKQVLSKIRKHNERSRNKELEHKKCTIYVSRRNKRRVKNKMVKEEYQSENDVISKLFERSIELSQLKKEYTFP